MKEKSYNRFDAEKGLALLALIVLMLILGLVAYTFVSIVSTHRYGSQIPNTSLQAFYITEGALEIGKKFVKDRWGTGTDVPLGADFTIFTDEPMGDGTFSVWASESDLGFATFTAAGNVAY